MSEFDKLDQYLLDNTNHIINRAPAGVSKILDLLRDEGFECYLVGGAVRDLFLGYDPQDWNLVTNASLAEIKEIFPEAQAVGTAFEVALIDKDGMKVEVARYRSENGHFASSLVTDLLQRDLTINALAVTRDESVRMQNTLEDMNDGIIRAIGEPGKRFLEDPLRMLRAIRFAAKFGFEIHTETWEAIKVNAALIQNVPAERTREELDKISVYISGDRSRETMSKLRESGILQFIASKLDNNI